MSVCAPERTRTDVLADAFGDVRGDLYSYARRRLADEALAEEAVGDTFLRAWRSIDRYDANVGSERMWLFGICRNAVADLARRRAREIPASSITDVEAIDGAAVDSAGDRPLVCQLAEDALSAMTPAQRDAVMQVLWFDRPYVDAAATLGVPVGTVKSRVHHGLNSARRAAA